ncbi:Sec-independent protein translocase subunit TatA/TatB [Deinococcus aquiradiocola]|uniref:Sec-independent protein translocase protein TatA n=1 Tax=Deinococcus aquiradiocola TaxID=393059 RepID=A0A917P756_9DEIO|nr:twin-arginine translocase TatA/TatE family subunit [Deinococcus aquiradiocola]GGJ65065.1 Sec-independent protein translocase protein TatA [Deinococcus aquiradiocola]
MPNLGFPEIMIILVVALLVFGPKKLPDLGRSLGNGIREFRKGTQGLKDELEGSLKDTPAQPAAPTPTIAAPTVMASQAAVMPSAPVTRVVELGKSEQRDA